STLSYDALTRRRLLGKGESEALRVAQQTQAEIKRLQEAQEAERQAAEERKAQEAAAAADRQVAEHRERTRAWFEEQKARYPLTEAVGYGDKVHELIVAHWKSTFAEGGAERAELLTFEQAADIIEKKLQPLAER